MYDYSKCLQRDILCIDLKSFFASVSCILHRLNPETTKLAVVADTKSKGAVVLAATPPLKKLGITTGSRKFDIPHRPDIYITNPKMRTYVDYSTYISEIALQYVAPEDFHQYSIDEFFMDITDSYRLFAPSAEDFARQLQSEIYKKTHIMSTIGVGPNLLLSKIAMDNEAKKNQHGIAEWRYADVPDKLWSLQHLTDMWGINKRTADKLHKRGIHSIKALAHYPHHYLKRDLGIIGVDLHLHANGIDESLIRHPHTPKQHTLNKSQILTRDYTLTELKTVLIEHVEALYYRAQIENHTPKTITVSLNYTDASALKKQFTHRDGYLSSNQIIQQFWSYIVQTVEHDRTFRTLSISFTNFKSSNVEQLSFFTPKIEYQARAIDHALVPLKRKYGHEIVTRASSLKPSSTLNDRKGLIAGHKA